MDHSQRTLRKQDIAFQNAVWHYYRHSGRVHLPWRQKSHLKPYDVLVSEMMLQQTQVERVVPKYLAFMKRWPNPSTLARSPLSEVLVAWQGLGYNRRAKYLHDAVKTVVREYGGRFPRTVQTLEQLPGIGPYTAGAVMVFAHNQPAVLIETNVRTVYFHHYFQKAQAVTDSEIKRLLLRTIDQDNPREWYWALMDYGSHLKHTFGNNTSLSKHYKKQTPFVGSERQVRGAIVRALATGTKNKVALHEVLPFSTQQIAKQLSQLEAEGLIVKDDLNYSLPS